MSLYQLHEHGAATAVEGGDEPRSTHWGRRGGVTSLSKHRAPNSGDATRLLCPHSMWSNSTALLSPHRTKCSRLGARGARIEGRISAMSINPHPP